MKIIHGDLPIVALHAIARSTRENVTVRDELNERREMFPSLRLKKLVSGQSSEETFDFLFTVINNLNLAGYDEPPQSHKAVHGRIHGKKINIDDRNRNS